MCTRTHVCVFVLGPFGGGISTWAALVRGSVLTVLSPGCACILARARARPQVRSGHHSGRWGAEEAHQGLTREDQRAHYHAFSLPLTLLFTSNKRPTGLSLRLLSCDNGTCPEPKEMNYLPRPSCTLERK